VVAGLIFIQATQPAYACTTVWKPDPTPAPAADASNRVGYLQPDMGRLHIPVGKSQRYTYCPPASGNHYQAAGIAPIIPARLFKPDDKVVPEQWIHNLEHGAVVVLYRGDSPGATADGQATFQQFFDSFPASPICKIPPRQLSPIIARFDDMATPYAAMVWDRVLPMDTWDPNLVLQFYATESERLDADGAFVAPPEPQCVLPSASPEPAASESAAPSAAPSAGPSASPEPSPSPS
jgi:hypothetical protein